MGSPRASLLLSWVQFWGCWASIQSPKMVGHQGLQEAPGPCVLPPAPNLNTRGSPHIRPSLPKKSVTPVDRVAKGVHLAVSFSSGWHFREQCPPLIWKRPSSDCSSPPHIMRMRWGAWDTGGEGQIQPFPNTGSSHFPPHILSDAASSPLLLRSLGLDHPSSPICFKWSCWVEWETGKDLEETHWPLNNCWH